MTSTATSLGEVVQRTDLRLITRSSDRCETSIRICLDGLNFVEWLVLGEAGLSQNKTIRNWALRAHLPEGVTDFEHDSAYALTLPLVGVEFLRTDYQICQFNGWVDANDFYGFRVPRPGYDPMKLKDSRKCRSGPCRKEPHVIVPEDCFGGAPFDKGLFRAVRGKRVEIWIGPVRESDA